MLCVWRYTVHSTCTCTYTCTSIVEQFFSSTLFATFSYEPELFPGLIYRMVRPRIVLLIFVSGKVVLTGRFTFAFKADCVGMDPMSGDREIGV